MSISLIIKVTGKSCNMDCVYCFYRGNHPVKPTIMSQETLTKVIQQAVTSGEDEVIFYWHGGEPLMAGVNFFKSVISLQNQYQKECHFENRLQTNATLLDEEYVNFFEQNNFGIGISLDGPPEINDFYRLDKNGNGTSQRVLNSIQLLQRAKIDFGTLVVVHRANYYRAREIVRYLLSIGIKKFVVNPCYEVTSQRTLTDFSITPHQYSLFLNELLDEILDLDDPEICVRNLDEPIGILLGKPPTYCRFQGRCEQFLTIDYQGDVYPCDCFMSKEFLLGNIHSLPIVEIIKSPRFKQWLSLRKVTGQKLDCGKCEWRQLCRGGCVWFNYLYSEILRQGKEYCIAQKEFFYHLTKKVLEKLEMLSER